MHDASAWVSELSNPANQDPARVGGKAAQLCQMACAGLPVPPGYVITVDAFRAHHPNARADEPVEPVAPSAELMTPLLAAFETLVDAPGDPVVVRSSAIAEDGQAASFAGQHATYYYIYAGDLARAVANCWLSLWSNAADAYRRERPPGDFGMAVIVQRMVQAESSGVCFTQDPTGQRPDHALVEATWGLGAALVDGRVSPDRFFVATDGTVSNQRIGRKRFKVAENLDNANGARLDHVPTQQQVAPAIDAGQLSRVVEMSRAIATQAGSPQDVEWAFEDQHLYLLQSRPITTRAQTTPPQLDGRWVIFKPISENFHEPLTPLTVDLYRRALPPFGRFVAGRYYLNFDWLQRLLPLRAPDSELATLMLLRGQAPNFPISWARLPACLSALALAYLTTGITWHRTSRLSGTSLWQFAALAEQLRADEAQDALTALQRMVVGKHAFEPIGHRIFQTNAFSARYFFLLDLLKRFVRRYAPDFDTELLEQVVTGDEDMLSKQMVEGIRQLAEHARGDAELEALLAAETTIEAGRRLGELPGSHPFVVGLEEFLANFGHRCAKELELASPRWREEPFSVLVMARNFLSAAPASPTADAYGRHLAARDAMHQALPRRSQRRLADHLVKRVRYYITLRENTRHFHSMAFDVLRTKLKQAEQQLIHRGLLQCADDIFFLSWEEVQGLQAQTLAWHDVEHRIRRRRREHLARSRSAPPETINLPITPPEADTSDADQSLHGYCASPGYAEGIVRVVLDPSMGNELQPGDILVAPYTDPAWTPLFPNVCAIVVEVGSYLSHAGTVAREYQIPCLVDVPNCTQTLRSGQRARVYASEGRVELVA